MHVDEDADDQQPEPFLVPSLSQQTLRLVLGVVYGNVKVSEVSQGLEGLARSVPTWGACFSQPPASELLPFVAGLLSPPAGPHVARLFAPRLLGALGQHALLSSTGAATTSTTATASSEQLQALGLLAHVCDALRLQAADSGPADNPFIAGALPMLMTAQPGGVRLAAAVRDALGVWATELQQACQPPATVPGHRAVSTRALAAAWAHVRLLPAACETPSQAQLLCERVRGAAKSALAAAAAQPQSSSRLHQHLLCVHGAATSMLAHSLAAQIAAGCGGDTAQCKRLQTDLVNLAEEGLQWLLAHAASPGAAAGAAALMRAAREQAASLAAAQQLLSSSRLEVRCV
jgi:hypothetical protein